MLSKITLENFFSFGDKEIISLNTGVNILIGINGSGKSNFIKSIQLLYEGIAGEGFEKLFVQKWSGFGHVANFSQSPKDYIKLVYEFDKDAINQLSINDAYTFQNNPVYELKIYTAGSTSYFLEENCYVINDDGTKFSFLEIRNGKGKISSRVNGKVVRERLYDVSPFSISEPVLGQISDPFRYLPLFTLKQAIKNLSIYSCFDTTLNSKIRYAKSSGFENKLLYDGDNLTPLLQKFQVNYPIEYEKIDTAVKKVNPYFSNVLFNQLGAKTISLLKEHKLAKTVSIEHISDGTLQFLLLLSILYNPERGTIVCIDEPEKGLHPDMTRTIADAIKSSGNSQCIIATHSPLLLNAFSIEDVFVFEKDENNQTRVNTLLEDDFDNWHDGILLGQLWLNGQIGGKRW